MYDKLDLAIMANELTRLYGKETAQQIMIENQDNLWVGYSSVAYNLGKRSIKFFALHYLRDMFIGEDKAPLSQTHYDSWNELTDMFLGVDVYNKRNYLFPRGFGKTSILSTPTVIWANLYGHSRLTVLGSAVKDTATGFMMGIKEGLTDNPRIRATWGELMSDYLINNSDKLQLTNDTMIMVASTRTTLRGANYKGNRINLPVLDDYQSEINTVTSEARDKHWNIFQRNVLPSVEKDKHWIIGYGTTQTPGDFYDRLTHDPTFRTQKKPAIKNINVFKTPEWTKFRNLLFEEDLEKALEYYNENKDVMEYERVWDYFSCPDLATLYFTDESSFRQEYQLEFADNSKVKFTNIRYYDNEHVQPRVLVIDPATGEDVDKDYTAFVLGDMIDDTIYVVDGSIARLEFDDYVDTVIAYLKEYESLETIIIEKQTYNGADILSIKDKVQRDMDLHYRQIEYINPHQSKNKDNKIDSIVGDVNLGRVQFNNKLEHTPALEQLADFKGVNTSKHDDFPDALSELVLYLTEDNLTGTVEVFDRGLLF